MPKMRIRLGHWNECGTIANLEDSDQNDVVITLFKFRCDAPRACRDAAKQLRKLADKFEALALEPEPFMCATQDKINK